MVCRKASRLDAKCSSEFARRCRACRCQLRLEKSSWHSRCSGIRSLVSLARPKLHHFAAGLLVFAAAATSAHAQNLKSLRLQVDNDWFLFWRPSTNRPDNNYTHGNVARAVFNVAPNWTRFGRPDCSAARHISPIPSSCVQSFFNFSQLIFTPTIDAPMPLP